MIFYSTRLRRALIGLLMGIAMLFLAQTVVFERLELFAIDLRYKLRGKRLPDPSVVVVGVTPECMEILKNDPEAGPSPWSKNVWAKIIDNLREAGASVIALDIFFPDVAKGDENGLENFTRAIREAGNVVLPVFLPTDEAVAKKTNYRNMAETLFQHSHKKLEDAVLATNEAGNPTGAIAHINGIKDMDVKIRSVPLIMKSSKGTESYRHLSLAAVQTAYRHEKVKLETHFEGNSLIVGDAEFQLLPGEKLRVNFSDAIHSVPFWKIWRADFSKGDSLLKKSLKGKIVLIGQTTLGLPNADVVAMPLKTSFGVYMQAEAISTILRGIRGEPTLRNLTGWKLATWFLAIGGLSCLLMGSKRLYWNVAWAPILMLSVAFVSLIAFHRAAVFVPTVSAGALVTASFLVNVLIGHYGHSVKAEQHEAALQTVREAESYITNLLAPTDLTQGQYIIAGAEKLAIADILASSAPQVILDSIGRAINARGGFLYQICDDGQIRLSASYGPEIAPEWTTDLPFFNSLAKHHESETAPINAPGAFVPEFLGEWAHKSFLSIRLTVNNGFRGFMSFYGKNTKAWLKREIRFTAEDMLLVLTMTPHSVVTLENSRLQRDLRNLWFESTRSLVNAIEAKDPYTRGHSDRVARYSGLIARETGLSNAECEIVRLTAILHDVGKIGITESILQKPGLLSDEEFELIKTHPDKGAVIINPLADFGVLLKDVRHHHERYDGGGYPDGLAGQQIPLIARIIGVADAFDAITSNRPYRKRRSPSQALQVLHDDSGTQFDPELVVVFDRIVHQEGFLEEENLHNQDNESVTEHA